MMIIPSARKFIAICIVSAATTVASQGAYAACYAPDQQLPSNTVSDFLGNPASLLSNPANAQGGNGLISMVRDLVASNPSALGAIIGLLGQANVAQQQAIGTGLGQAANLCQRPDPNFAADISQALAQSSTDPNTPAKTTYAAAIGKPIGSVANGGAGGGVSGGSVGGSTNPTTPGGVGSSTPFVFTQGGAFSTGTNYFGGTATGISGSTTTNTTTTTTVSSSVSK